MSKFTDLILGTQLSTSIAWICAIGADYVVKHGYEQWQWSVYVILVISLVFMLVPHIMFEPEIHNEPNEPKAC